MVSFSPLIDFAIFETCCKIVVLYTAFFISTFLCAWTDRAISEILVGES